MTVPVRVRKLDPYDVFAVVENRFERRYEWSHEG